MSKKHIFLIFFIIFILSLSNTSISKARNVKIELVKINNETYDCYADNVSNLVGYNIYLEMQKTCNNLSINSSNFIVVWDYVDPLKRRICIMGVSYNMYNNNTLLFTILGKNLSDITISCAEFIEWDNTNNSFRTINLTTGEITYMPIYRSTNESYNSKRIITTTVTTPPISKDEKTKTVTHITPQTTAISTTTTFNSLTIPVVTTASSIKTDVSKNVTTVCKTITNTITKINTVGIINITNKNNNSSNELIFNTSGFEIVIAICVIFLFILLNRRRG